MEAIRPRLFKKPVFHLFVRAYDAMDKKRKRHSPNKRWTLLVHLPLMQKWRTPDLEGEGITRRNVPVTNPRIPMYPRLKN